MPERNPCALSVAAAHPDAIETPAAKIADRLAEALRAQELDVDLRDIKQMGDADPGGYDAVVVGTSLHAGHHQSAGFYSYD